MPSVGHGVVPVHSGGRPLSSVILHAVANNVGNDQGKCKHNSLGSEERRGRSALLKSWFTTEDLLRLRLRCLLLEESKVRRIGPVRQVLPVAGWGGVRNPLPLVRSSAETEGGGGGRWARSATSLL